jgi:hypothetical protein|tara:strand:- start:1512 stop:1982 length:471 start_codon:yes stop_codon:yes gene_type:complete
MLIQAKKQAGRLTESQTIIETKIIFEGGETQADIESGVFTVEKLRGSDLYIGLDSDAGTFLNFKTEDELDEERHADFTNTNIYVTHKAVGDESIIKVIFKYRLKSEVASLEAATAAWWNDGSPEEGVDAPADMTRKTIETTELATSWIEDSDGNWV